MAIQAPLLNMKGEKIGSVDLSDKIFGLVPKVELVHEFVSVYLANQRTARAKTKSRAEVSGGGKKPWKQKHTGRARAGSIRSPLWRHGGVIFGPRGHEIRRSIPRQKALKALAHALAAQFVGKSMVFLDGVSLEAPKTKLLLDGLKKLDCAGKTLLVLGQSDKAVTRAGRNLPNLRIALEGDLNAYDVLNAHRVLVTKPALEKLQARWN